MTRSAERLRRLLGEWRVTVEGTTDGERIRGVGSVWGEEAMGGGVLLNVVIELEGRERYEEANLFGHSEEEEKVHQFTVGSYGQVHDHVGGWRSDDVLFVEWSGISGGRPMTEKIRYEWKGADMFEVHETDVTAGKVQGTFVFTVTRTSPPIKEQMAMPT